MKRRLALAFTLLMAPLFTLPETTAAPSNQSPTTIDYFNVSIVRPGDFGPNVWVVQLRLHSMGYSVVLDSVYGPQTYRAVTHFQGANGLVKDGVVGPATQRALGIALAGSTARTPSSIFQPTSPSRTVNSPTVVANVERWHSLAIQAGWTEAQWPKLACIINRESRGNPLSNTSGHWGLLQIHTGTLGYIQQAGGTNIWQLFDPAMNLAVGYRMFLARGWGPWASTTGGC